MSIYALTENQGTEITAEEIKLFYLAALLCVGSPTNTDEYFNFRLEYWKDDSRMSLFQRKRGVPVEHPLSINNYQRWYYERQGLEAPKYYFS